MAVDSSNNNNNTHNNPYVVSLWKEVAKKENPIYWEIKIKPHGNSICTILSEPTEDGTGSIVKIAAARFFALDLTSEASLQAKFSDRSIYYTYDNISIKCESAHSVIGVGFTTPNLSSEAIALAANKESWFRIVGQNSELWSVNIMLYETSRRWQPYNKKKC